VCAGNTWQLSVSINDSLKTGFGLGIEHHIKWPIDDDFLPAGKQVVQTARRRDAAYPQTHAEALIRLRPRSAVRNANSIAIVLGGSS
jgi:hypothetical protein